MDAIKEKIEQWEFLSQLPQLFAGFTLNIEKAVCGTQYKIFTYYNYQNVRSFSVIYDKATKDFLARVSVGLTEYCDVNFIFTSLEKMEMALKDRLEVVLQSLAVFNPQLVDSVFLDKKILEWRYAADLPVEIAGFNLYICPTEPVKIINGSYIIMNYCDFAQESDLVIYYNILRDEFFAELRIRRTPKMISDFDARTLDELKEKLAANLESILEQLRHSIS